MRILQIYFPVLALTFCVGVRNCPSRSRWVANKQPPVLDRENTVSEAHIQLLTNIQYLPHEGIFDTIDIAGADWIRVCHLYPVTPNTVAMGAVWKEEFSHWLRCSSFGRCCSSARPISNSQGYFQLITHTCHLDAEAALSIIANQRWNLAMHTRQRVLE